MPDSEDMTGEPQEADGQTPTQDEPLKDSADKSEASSSDETQQGMTDDSSGPTTSSSSDDDDDDDDSNEAVGKEEAAKEDQDMMDIEDDKSDEQVSWTVDPSEPAKVTSMFQKILALGSSSGQIVVKVNDSDGSGNKSSASAPAPGMGPSASLPTLVQNGRLVSMTIVGDRAGHFCILITTTSPRDSSDLQSSRSCNSRWGYGDRCCAHR